MTMQHILQPAGSQRAIRTAHTKPDRTDEHGQGGNIAEFVFSHKLYVAILCGLSIQLGNNDLAV